MDALPQGHSTQSENDSSLLEQAVAFSAGLHNVMDRSEITSNYSHLLEFRNKWLSIDQSLTRDGVAPKISCLETLERQLRSLHSNRLMIASSYFGHPIAFASSCARNGIATTLLYQNISSKYVDALTSSGVSLIDISLYGSFRELAIRMDDAVNSDSNLVVLFDAPNDSRRRCSFLGYQVTTSPLISLYVRRRDITVLPLLTRVMSSEMMTFSTYKEFSSESGNIEGRLLAVLEEAIRGDPFQYKWSANSIFFSDDAARINGISFLDEILRWRASL